MSNLATESMGWTTQDLESLPDDGKRYEIIDGELIVTRAPHWGHQRTCGKIYKALENWSEETNLGETIITPGIIFSDADNVIPDVIWISSKRLQFLLDEAGHLTAAPELIVEVLSSGNSNEKRDRELKLQLYSTRGVQEYWIADWRLQQLEVYRREQAKLNLVATLFTSDEITSPLLPGFSCSVARFFA